MVCYRGGFISAEEFERMHDAVSEFVQNLGFLSTSESIEAAFGFKINVLYQIRLSNLKADKNMVPGFAKISTFSLYFSEK